MLSDLPLEYAHQNRSHIEAYWAACASVNPRLWNGAGFLFTDVALSNGILCGTAHRADFATFLYWRDHGRGQGVEHITGTSFPICDDGVVVAMEMAAHTANGGQIYFPAGSFDEADLESGQLSIQRNVVRELGEETGLVPTDYVFEDALVASNLDDCWHIALPCRLRLRFAECQMKFERHQRETGDDELVRLVPIASAVDSAKLKPYAAQIAQWHFERSGVLHA